MIVRSGVVLSHLVLADTDVTSDPDGGWRVIDASATGGGSVLRDGDVVESWDALKSLHMVRSLTPPADMPLRLGLEPESARFAVVVVGTTGRGIHRRLLCYVDVHMDGSPIHLEVRPEGDLLLRDLQLSTALVLVDPGMGGETLAPSTKGARLWVDLVRLQLEGGRPRLPMEVLSFRTIPAFRGFENALFHVDVADDADLGIEQGLLVHLNADNPSFISRVEAREPVATALLWEGIVRQFLREALVKDLDVADSHIAGSIGATARRWVDMAFRGRSLDEVASLARDRPAEFDAIVDSWCGSVRRLFGATDVQ